MSHSSSTSSCDRRFRPHARATRESQRARVVSSRCAPPSGDRAPPLRARTHDLAAFAAICAQRYASDDSPAASK
jgi:hypothetical protein